MGLIKVTTPPPPSHRYGNICNCVIFPEWKVSECIEIYDINMHWMLGLNRGVVCPNIAFIMFIMSACSLKI